MWVPAQSPTGHWFVVNKANQLESAMFFGDSDGGEGLAREYAAYKNAQEAPCTE